LTALVSEEKKIIKNKKKYKEKTPKNRMDIALIIKKTKFQVMVNIKMVIIPRNIFLE